MNQLAGMKRASDDGLATESRPSSRRRADESSTSNNSQHQILVVHNVKCSGTHDHGSHPEQEIYLDQPRLFKGDSRASVLRGSNALRGDIKGHMALNSHLNIIVQRDYDCPLFYQSLG